MNPRVGLPNAARRLTLTLTLIGGVGCGRFDQQRLAFVPTHPVEPSMLCTAKWPPRRVGAGTSKTRCPGARTPQSIQERVRASYPRLRRCYEDALGRSADSHGQVAHRFTILPSGAVDGVCLYVSEVDDQLMAACMRDVFESLDFGVAPCEPVKVHYPLNFVPG